MKRLLLLVPEACRRCGLDAESLCMAGEAGGVAARREMCHNMYGRAWPAMQHIWDRPAADVLQRRLGTIRAVPARRAPAHGGQGGGRGGGRGGPARNSTIRLAA